MRKDKKQNVKKAAAQNKFRAKNPMQTLKRILGYWKPYRGQLIGALICMIANVLCNIAGTFMLGSVVVNNYILPLAYANGVYVTSNAEIIARAAASHHAKLRRYRRRYGGNVRRGRRASLSLQLHSRQSHHQKLSKACVTRCSKRWKNCPSNISTLTPTAT